MGILNFWQEARGNVLRQRWVRLNQRINSIDDNARASCLDYIKWRFDPLSNRFARSSEADRTRIRKRAAQMSRELIGSGNWPSALGLAVMMMNIEVRSLPGNDAAFVKSASDALIAEARGLSSSVSPTRIDGGHSGGRVRHEDGSEEPKAVPPWERELNEAPKAVPPWERELNEALAAFKISRR